MGKIESDLAGMKKLMEAISQQRSSQPQEDPAALDNSQQRSSVASTADDHALIDDAPGPRYPVDDVREMKECELHQPMKNMSFKVAVGTALPCLPGALHHGNPIPAGYARVTMDDLVPGYEDLEIDYVTPEGDVKLRDVKRQVILWQKKYIKFTGSAPRPPTPRIPSPPPQIIVQVQVHLDLRRVSRRRPLVHLRRVSRHRPLVHLRRVSRRRPLIHLRRISRGKSGRTWPPL